MKVDELVQLLEKVRAITGRPLVVVSGYRCEPHNKAVGGAPKSQHLLGRAADIRAGHATGDQARALGARGIGCRGAWAVHVDVRTGPPATWEY
jgi:uncharacterized protein YcbK (DUF882 family)